jgi:autotransporter adhesin
LNATSTDAVNGAQLFTTDQRVTANTTNLSTLTTNVSNRPNEIDTGTIGIVQQVGGATGAITVGAATSGGVDNFSGVAGARVLRGVASGQAATDAVNVSQLDFVATVAGNAVQSDSVSTNTATLGGAVSLDVGITNGTKLTSLTQGVLSSTSTDAVNGAQLQAANENISNTTNNLSSLTTQITNGTIGLV